jgi:hypothetical protein
VGAPGSVAVGAAARQYAQHVDHVLRTVDPASRRDCRHALRSRKAERPLDAAPPRGDPRLALVAVRLEVQGLRGGRWQAYRTVAGMVAFITAVLAGSSVGLLAATLSAHSLAAALAAGGTAAGPRSPR